MKKLLIVSALAASCMRGAFALDTFLETVPGLETQVNVVLDNPYQLFDRSYQGPLKARFLTSGLSSKQQQAHLEWLRSSTHKSGLAEQERADRFRHGELFVNTAGGVHSMSGLGSGHQPAAIIGSLTEEREAYVIADVLSPEKTQAITNAVEGGRGDEAAYLLRDYWRESALAAGNETPINIEDGALMSDLHAAQLKLRNLRIRGIQEIRVEGFAIDSTRKIIRQPSLVVVYTATFYHGYPEPIAALVLSMIPPRLRGLVKFNGRP